MVMRISGLASGMDVDQIVTDLMKAERMPLDKIYQKKIYTEWQRDDYRTMNTALSELDTLIFDGIGKQSSFNKKMVTVSDSDALSVKNVNSTSDFSGTIKNVTQLATAATMVSTEDITDADVLSTTKMKELLDFGTAEVPITQKITIKAINKDGGFDKVINADGTMSEEDKVYTLEIKADDTLESVINKINADSSVTVFFDEKSKQFSITAKNTGNAGDALGKEAIQLTGDLFTGVMKMEANSKLAANKDIIDAEGKSIKAGATGTNAKLTYNNLAIERASNTFTINGAEITLKKEITDTDPPVTFSSTPDVDAVYDTIKKFVDSYNSLIATISDKTSEKKSSSYAPLTDKQKEAMTEDAVGKWETLAKKGTLRNDSSLNSLLTKMRTSIYTSVSDTSFNSLSKIGIVTTKNYLQGGKLEIDEETLRAAIAKDPNGIYNLFMANGEETKVETKDGTTTTTTTTDFSKNGIARRLRADLKTAMTDIGEKAGKTSSVNNTFTLGRLLDGYENKISAFEERMTSLEDRYYKQFTAMEKAIQNANSQSASLSSFFSK